ncbi:MAG: hypothetical protein ACLQU3_13660, partial [Limisphaerales bacterium]
EVHPQTRGSDKSPLLIARLLLLTTIRLLLLTRLSPFARTATEAFFIISWHGPGALHKRF